MPNKHIANRRQFFTSLGFGTALFTVPGLFAEQLVLTPHSTEGPFYPDKLPLDTDNDLIVINGAITPAVGEITWLTGRILDSRGEPIRNTLVEIWQVDHNGAYLHTKTGNADKRDTHFQGFGRFLTGSTGEYVFRTVKPVPYPGRTPHIHFAIYAPGQKKWTTQCYIAGHPGNAKDGVLRAIKAPKQLQAVMVPFLPMQGSTIGEISARFEIVLGFTPNV